MENIVNFRILYLIPIIAVLATGTGLVSAKPAKTAVMLEIIDGDTAFVVDKTNNAAWWVVGECRRPIPVEPRKNSQKNIGKNSINTITSKIIRNNTRIGSRQIVLKQQFRFTFQTNQAGTPNGLFSTPIINVEVYNSLRGGWSAVPVRQNAQCAYDATCRQRMEAPEC